MFERAKHTFDRMLQEEIQPESWLYDTFVYHLLDRGEIDESLQMLEQRDSQGYSASSENVWYALLDVASSSHHVSRVKVNSIT